MFQSILAGTDGSDSATLALEHAVELTERLDAVLDAAERAASTVVLVGRGSTDPDANAEHVKVARLLWEGSGLAGVEPAFVSLAEAWASD